MNKKHLIGVLIVLLISCYVFYQDLKTTDIKSLLLAVKQINPYLLALVFLAMILSFICEAGIIKTLAYRKNDPHYSTWSFLRIPIIQALFNAITPMSTGGQPSQLVAMMQMGIDGGRATSILLMKFILFQVVVFFAYISTIVFGFHMVATKFSALAIFIFIGFLIHITSIIILFSIMFVYNWTKNVANKIINLLGRFFSKEKTEKWRKNILKQIDSFYFESQKLKREKKRLFVAVGLTIMQLLLFYSIPYLVLIALQLKASWIQVTQMNIMIIMFMSIVPLPGASGGAEFSFQTLFRTFVSSHILLVLAMFLWRFTTYFLGMILGLFGWLFKPKKMKSN